ncbi:MAG: hypothetical protein LQ339_007770 [Xanthoria mediterranea]|nr:MAG: hypothetical protein LQ339_007770 [Xanthoria mediterranea]
MQGPTSRHGSTSTVNSLELHRSLTPADSLASSPSTLVELTPSNSYASSVSDSILPGWDAEAEDILRGTDLQAIQLLCRYRTYRDDSIPGSILRTKWAPILNSFLLRLSAGTYSRGDVADLDLDQKVQEILQRLVLSFPVEDPWRHWASRAALQESDASCVALQLNEESLLRFRKITFSDYVREALYPEEYVDSVEDYIDWHNGLFNEVFDRLENFPDEVEKYAQIEQWAISQSLLLALSHRPITDVAPQPDLGFIYRPLREFFRHRDRNLAQTLKQLAVLEARFQRLYLREEEIDRTHLFDTSTDLFDRATTTPPQDLAHSLTDCDIAAFRSLDPQSIISEGPYLRHMHRRWDRLCGAAQEMVTVESRLGPLLADLAEASLWTLLRSQFADNHIRNYISDGTSTAYALYFKLYERLASMNLNCHTSLFS